MSKFKVGNSKFSRFINGKGFYIALALCLVAIGSAAYIAVNNTKQAVSKVSTNKNGTVSKYSPTDSYPAWDESSEASSSSSDTSSGYTASSSSQVSSDANSVVFTMPVQGTAITPYSNGQLVYDKTLDEWQTHEGVDISASEGTPVKACAAGTVDKVEIDTSDHMLGETVEIDHGNGLKSIYCNLTNQVTVHNGQHVEAGDAIGCVGETAQGESAEASHLHFAMTKNGLYIDLLKTIAGK